MPSTDTRIVQMQFDNKDFEKNLGVSEKSLEKFKNELNFDEQEKNLKNFGDLLKQLDFASLIDNVGRLANKFTGLGTITEHVASQIRSTFHDLENKVNAFVSSLTTEQFAAGQEKFNMLNKSVQTIKAATGRAESEVYGVLERLNRYTDQTSYNFSDMAQNIGKFTSVGIPLEKAERQMEGIANWAARSGAGINEASRAMYNLSQAMGVGSLKLMDWRSIENAGMATKEFKEQLIAAGVAAGTLVKEVDKKTGATIYKTAKSLGTQMEVNYSNLSSTLSKGWANKDVLGATLENYYWDDLYYEGVEAILQLSDDQKKAFDKMFENDEQLSAQEYKTLKEMGIITEETKKKILDLAVTNNKLKKKVQEDGTVIYTAVDKTGKNIEFTMDQLETSLSAGWFDKSIADKITGVNELAKASYEAAQKCLTFKDVIQAWKDQISTGFMNSFKHIFGELSESMEIFSTICNKVGEEFTKIIELINGNDETPGILNTWAEGFGGRDSLWSLIIGEYRDGEDVMYEGAYGLLDVMKDVGKLLMDGFWEMIGLTVSDPNHNQDDWMENEEYRIEYLSRAIKDGIESIKYWIASIRDFFNTVPEGQTKSRIQIIQDIVTGALSYFLLLWTIFKKFAKFVGNVINALQPSFDAIAKLFARIGQGIKDTARAADQGNGIDNFFNRIFEEITPLIELINDFVEQIADMITEFIDSGTESGSFINTLTTIASVFLKLFSVILRIATPIIRFVSDIFKAFSDLFGEGINDKSITKFGDSVKAAFKKIGKSILDGLFGEGTFDKVKNFLKYIFGFVDEKTDEELEAESGSFVGKLKKWLRTIFGFVSGIFDSFKGEEGQQSLAEIFQNGINFDSIKAFFTKIGDMFKGVDFGKLIKQVGKFGLLIGAFAGLISVIKSVKKIRNFFSNFNLFDLFGAGNTGGGVESFSKKFLHFAIAIGILIAGIVILANMKWQSVAVGVGALAAVLLAVLAFVFVFKKMITKMNIKDQLAVLSALTLIVAIAFAVALLIFALRPLASMEWGDLAKMAAGLVVVLGALYLASKKMGTFKNTGMIGAVLLAIGIFAIVMALRPLASMEWGNMAKMGAGLIVIVGILIVFTKMASYVKASDVGGVIVAAASVWIVIQSLLPLANIPWENLGKMGAGLAVIMGGLIIFSRLVKEMKIMSMAGLLLVVASIWVVVQSLLPLAKMNWEQLAKMGAGLVVILTAIHMFNDNLGSMRFGEMAGLIMVVAAIWIIVQSLMPLAKMKWEQLGKMGAGLGTILAVIWLFLKFAPQSKGFGIDIGVLAGAIVAIINAIKPLAEYKWSELGKMGAGLAGVMTILLGFLYGLKKIDSKGSYKVLFVMYGLALAVWLMIKALSPLASVSWDGLGRMGAGLAGFALIMSLFVYALTKIENTSQAIKNAVALALLGAVVWIFVQALLPLASVSWEDLAKMGVGLVGMFAILFVVSKIADKFDASKLMKVLVPMAGLAAIMYVFALSMAKVKNMKMEQIIAFAAGLSVLMLAMSAALILVKDIDLGSALKGILILSVAMAAIMAVIAIVVPMMLSAIGHSLAELSSRLSLMASLFGDFINKMNLINESDITATMNKFDLFYQLITSLKDVSGYYGAVDVFTRCMIDLGSGLELYAVMTEGVRNPDNDPAMMLVEKALSLKDQMTSFKIGNFATGIQKLGSGIAGFATNTADVSTDEPMGWKLLKRFIDNIDEIERLANMQGIENITSKMQGLGGALSLYAMGAKQVQEVEGLSDSDIDDTNVDFAVKIMEKIAESLGKEGGFELPEIPKESEIGTFPSDLAALANAVVAFANACEEFDNGKTQNALDALDFFAKLKTGLAAEDFLATLGYVGIFKDAGIEKPDVLQEFGLDIRSLGGAMADFQKSASTIDDAKMASALKALDYFRELKNKLTVNDLKYALIFKIAGVDNYDFAAFSRDINSLGDALAKFATNVNFDKDSAAKFEAGLSALDFLVGLRNKMPLVGGLKQLIGGYVDTLSSLAGDVTALGTALKEFSDKITADNGVDFDIVNQALESVYWLVRILNIISNTFNDFSSIEDPNGIFSSNSTGEIGIMDWSRTYVAFLMAFMKQLTDGITYYGKSNTTLNGYASEIESFTASLANFAKDFALSLEEQGLSIEQFKDSTEIMKNIFSAIGELASLEFSDDIGLKPIGGLIGTNIAQGITDSTDVALQAIDELMKSIKVHLGIYQSEENNLFNPTDIGEVTTAIKAADTIKNDFKIIGYAMADGIIEGIKERKDIIINSVRDILKEVRQMADNPNVNNLSNASSITPVIDFTYAKEGLNNYINDANHLLGSSHSVIDTTQTTKFAMESMSDEDTSAIDAVRDEVAKLRADLRTVAQGMSKLRVVMNSGALVGAIGPDMDEYLGREGFYVSREVP